MNFIAGWELDLETMQLLRAHFKGPIYCDLHSKLLGVDASGLRIPEPMADAAAWCRCADVMQVNEDEMELMAPDPMALAATALASGVHLLCVTMGKRGGRLLRGAGLLAAQRPRDAGGRRTHSARSAVRWYRSRSTRRSRGQSP